jgi:hypothetical protein
VLSSGDRDMLCSDGRLLLLLLLSKR